MRVLLVYTNQSREMEPAAPVGLSYVASAASAAGHEVELLDLAFATDLLGILAARINAFRPDVVGLSVRNIDNVILQRCESPLQDIIEQISVIRTHARNSAGEAIPLVLGGPAISILAERTLDVFGADYAIVGEGELAFPALLAALESGSAFEKVSGLCYRRDGKVMRNPTTLMQDFGSSGMQQWVSWKPYQHSGGTWPIQTKRGCPMSCTYCAYPLVEGRRCRSREPGEVVDEIEQVLRDVGPRTFEFVDSTFNAPSSHAIAICEEIIRRRVRANFTVMGVNPRDVPPELFPVMKRAGFNSMLISAEAGCDPMLKSLGKGFSMKEVDACRARVANSGIKSIWFFMLGAPGENMDTCEESIHYAESRLQGRQFLSVIFTGIRILPGTALARQAIKSGDIAADTDFSQGCFYLSPQLDEQRVIRRINQAIVRNPCIVHAADGRISRTQRLLYRGLDALGVAPPYWRFVPYYLSLPPLHYLRSRYPSMGTVGVG